MTVDPPVPLPSALPAARTMRRSAVILVDVGYLLAQAAQAVCGEPRRGAVRLRDFGITAVAELTQAAVRDDGLDVLRVYWYDGAPERAPNQQQRVIGRQPRVKLRLGYQVGGTQKGVDKLIQRDMTGLSANKAVTDIILLSGDQDLLEEFDDAGQHGMVMRLWGIADGDSGHSQSSKLIRAADEWRLFDAGWASRIVTAKSALDPEPLAPAGADPLLSEVLDGPPTDAEPKETRIVSGPATAGAAAPSPRPEAEPEPEPAAQPAAPKPTALARSRPAALRRVHAAGAASPVRPSPAPAATAPPAPSRLAYSVGPAGATLHVGNGPGCTEAGRQVFDVLRIQFGDEFAPLLRELKARSMRGYHQLPVMVDAQLMDSAEGILGRSLRDSESDRLAVRGGLWERVASA